MDLELFKAEDFYDFEENSFGKVQYMADIANRILSERLSVNTCVVDKGDRPYYIDCGGGNETHRIYYHLIPLETEEPECDHHKYGTAIFETDEKGWTSASNTINNYCPECGKKLNDQS